MDSHYRVKFSRTGDIRFLSHLDILRVFERALRRSGLPLAFTSGFNPRVRTSFAQALSVGLESSEEWMLATLSASLESSEVLTRLASQMPAGLCIHHVESQPSRKLPPISHSEWEMQVPRPCVEASFSPEGADAALVGQLSRQGCTLRLEARHVGGRSIHPRTILKSLGYTEEEVLSARIRRLRTILDEPSAHHPEPITS